ncbi:N-acetylmuramoyl-L-alanine amidase family protein [Roseibacillus ishigakijimensis]|uniref:N-acetylmuramoyl-L-alanine amidase n=1 Tax=Roseibacillus ishigakijimensis TaxID=454146 RepID=A0A934VM85_9BACT|nr:N-acetylmuramoyl-L-alanine amidase [Roseibacillus ishigakijimensis]MBK1835489.1 N-acetylmuramoyl-L-alanine amidase [Roseibacillus ishigakijimensis]
MNPRIFVCLLLAFLAPLAPAQQAVTWENVTIGKESYVTVRSIKDFYGFTTMRRAGSKLVLEKRGVRIEFLVGQQSVWMNQIKFVFTYPIKQSGGRYLVHRIDLVKLFDPVMRPHNVCTTPTRIDTVIIDPGHGGRDPGTVSPHGNGNEKDHALAVSRKLAAQLQERGFKVGLTRRDDRYLSLQQRVDYANQFPNALFISIHFNSGGGGRAHGIETFTLSPQGVAHYGRGLKASDFTEKPGNNNDSANVALATAVHSNVIKATGREDRGIRRARYSVLSGVKHPALLLEGGFLSNRVEGSYIRRSDYQDRLAYSIAEAVVKYKMATERAQRR